MSRPQDVGTMRVLGTWVTLVAGLLLVAASPRAEEPITPAELSGTWAGTVEHDGETQPLALHFEPADSGRIAIRFSMPVIHMDRISLGAAKLVVDSAGTRLGPWRLELDRAAGTLTSAMPAGFVPVYSMPFTLRKVERFDAPDRAAPSAPLSKPIWIYDAGSAVWAGPAFANGMVFAGGQDGRLHALDARTGVRRWAERTGGAIRTRPTIAKDVLYVQSDDGFLYCFEVATGTQRWRVRIVDQPIQRLPFDNPKSRFDRFGSDVVVHDGRLLVGTHDGKLLALDPTSGARLWEFQTGDAVLAAPAVAGDRVVFGSYDKHVYAIELATGRLLWKRDTQGAVVSTPAIDGDLVIVGNRAYDLLGLALDTGTVVWRRYLWMSWVESSPVVFQGTVYVGSSDAAAVFAVDALTGTRRWTTDVHGWAWGRPAVTGRRVYAGTSGQTGYLAQHSGAVLALDRKKGAMVWRYPAPSPIDGPYGFPGSIAVGEGLVFAGSIDGRVVALKE